MKPPVVYFTADPHYYHINIARFAHRPFIQPGDLAADGNWADKKIGQARAKEMTDVMVGWHNEIVQPQDMVYCLGDFTFGDAASAASLLRRLNGTYAFIWGNHDKGLRDLAAHKAQHPDLLTKVQFLGNLEEVTVLGQTIVLCHYALRVWRNSHRGAWHLYGHSHGGLADDPCSRSFDVGVDCHNLRPVSFAQVADIMAKKTFVPVDHHR